MMSFEIMDQALMDVTGHGLGSGWNTGVSPSSIVEKEESFEDEEHTIMLTDDFHVGCYLI